MRDIEKTIKLYIISLIIGVTEILALTVLAICEVPIALAIDKYVLEEYAAAILLIASAAFFMAFISIVFSIIELVLAKWCKKKLSRFVIVEKTIVRGELLFNRLLICYEIGSDFLIGTFFFLPLIIAALRPQALGPVLMSAAFLLTAIIISIPILIFKIIAFIKSSPSKTYE